MSAAEDDEFLKFVNAQIDSEGLETIATTYEETQNKINDEKRFYKQ
jgi:hypothetical protein